MNIYISTECKDCIHNEVCGISKQLNDAVNTMKVNAQDDHCDALDVSASCRHFKRSGSVGLLPNGGGIR